MDQQICCPKFDPAAWDDKAFEWENKRFIKDRVFTLFYIPIGFGKTMQRLCAQVQASAAAMPDNLCLSDHTSKWNMDLYLAVDKEIEGAQNVSISGSFFCKVYEGPYKNTGKWCGDFESLAKRRGFDIKKWFMWYTTCPKCAKKYGKNYVAILAKTD